MRKQIAYRYHTGMCFRMHNSRAYRMAGVPMCQCERLLRTCVSRIRT